MTRINDFALAYNAAHEKAGLTRISVSHILKKIEEDPNYLFSDDFQKLGGHCPVHHGTRSEDFDKVVVNTTLSQLYPSLVQHIASRMPLEPDGRLILPPAPESPYRIDPNDKAAMAAASPEVVCKVLRDCMCHLLDALIREWAVGVFAEEERCRQSGDITTEAAASFMLESKLSTCELYAPSDYNLLSITCTGSHTALHVCWSLIESAPLLVPGRDDAFYDALLRRSGKHVAALATGSLGMLVHYLGAANIEADDHQATHVLPKDQKAFFLDTESDPDGLILLNTGPIKPSAAKDEHYYTGCPAVYTQGMIKLYLELCLVVAEQFDVYIRLQERSSAG
jgi:hypothetical protein